MISIQRSTWKQEHLALVCGIANAGGGTLTIASAGTSRLATARKARRFFENVMTLTQESLGLACSTEPVMVNGQLATEIIIPAAHEPIRYNSKYYMWRHNENDVVSRDEAEGIVNARNEAQQAASADAKAVSISSGATPVSDDAAAQPQDADASPVPNIIIPTAGEPSTSFNEKSIAAANDLDLTAVDEYVIKVLTVNGRATAVKIADYLGVSESTVHRSYKKLRGLGIIRRIGSTKAGYWKVLI